MKPIAICKNDRIFKHSTQWTGVWENYCEKNNISYEIVDCYESNIVYKLKNYSALLWHYSNYVIADLLEAQNILRVAEKSGILTFPNESTGWHTDDKIAEMYVLSSVDAQIPENWVFYEKDKCLEWLKNKAEYPLIAKLRRGSGSNNVKLLKDYSEAERYASRMYSKGFSPAPSLMYKAYSKAQSSKSINDIVNRIKKIPEFLRTRSHSHMMPIEKGYCYFQEYIPNDGFDLKIAVVGDKVSFLTRDVRKGDFRASGGGSISYDKSVVSKQIVDSAFYAADKLGLQCIGFDYVVDSRNGIGKIIEMSYGFDYNAILNAGGYWDRSFLWHNSGLNAPEEVIKNIIELLKKE